MADAAPDDAGRTSYLHDDLMVEYYRLADTVASFDQRLLTVKSWGVTFSPATLALGFQQDHYGLFLVAAAGALGFWLIEGSTKSHQIRYYPRMGDIETLAHELYGEHTMQGTASSPLINWGWQTAAQRIWGERSAWRKALFKSGPGGDQRDPRVPQPWEDFNRDPGVNYLILLWPHVALPHAIAVALGLVLFVLGLIGRFGPI